MSVTLCVLLWAHPGRDDDLVAYEDTVLELLGDHEGRVLQRARTTLAERLDPSATATATAIERQLDDRPLEVQLLEFGSDDALDAYLHDERRLALAEQRDHAVARTEVLRVDLH